MAKVTNQDVIALLSERFGDKIIDVNEPYGLLTFETTKDVIIEVLKFLKENSVANFNFLTDITAVHYPEKKHGIAVVYHLHSMVKGIRVRVKVFIDAQHPTIPSATSVWNGANWMERETYDFFGVKFEGHPDLRRILNMDDLGVFPMLKQYPLEDPNRVDKKDEYFGR
ncbi:MAG: NADH-quinone oxidoreductase subunit C [Candidatus Pedobacter colombiensis]|uniref:NADH-quinone oxidoreductase subunit C n=1 Tax=Candidatus Pedobacter colombiensis TaxID=3121371 RepID=A0AAJ5W9J4_9SPHI|nr:NADH-quinone oxidoreductase subunit C [Pedobacter sp.]WEK19570.1 MAG: NADH-quinone oxidoreductase subunit C [Pedobacter sp.]